MNNALLSTLKRLSRRSIDAVQSDQGLDEYKEYLHIVRPVEDQLKQKIKEINEVNGGIIILTGSAGDGKSHLISVVKQSIGHEYQNLYFYNDATESISPTLSAFDTLRMALSSFNDENIEKTDKKLVLAINLGKLNDFIERDSKTNEFSILTTALELLFSSHFRGDEEIDTERIKIINLSNNQLFEFTDDERIVTSDFLSSMLQKITDAHPFNPFYCAFKEANKQDRLDPVVINYMLLCNKYVQDTILQLLIKAIVEFKLFISVRDFQDFIYQILVHRQVEINEFDMNQGFSYFLPELLFNGGDNKILKAFQNLDPLKDRNKQQDYLMTKLYGAIKLPQEYADILSKVEIDYMVNLVKHFFENDTYNPEEKLRYKTVTISYLCRCMYLFDYRSDDLYLNYLRFLRGYYHNNKISLKEIYDITQSILPKIDGSFIEGSFIPLPISGRVFSAFVPIKMKSEPRCMKITHRNNFALSFPLYWRMNEELIELVMDFQLFKYIKSLFLGKVPVKFIMSDNMYFNTFVNTLIRNSSKNIEMSFFGSNNQRYDLRYDDAFESYTFS